VYSSNSRIISASACSFFAFISAIFVFISVRPDFIFPAAFEEALWPPSIPSWASPLIIVSSLTGVNGAGLLGFVFSLPYTLATGGFGVYALGFKYLLKLVLTSPAYSSLIRSI